MGVAMPTTRIERLDRWMAMHHGVVSRQALLRMGFSPESIKRLVRSERWVRELPGVYRSPQHPPTRQQKLAVICLWSPRAVIGFTTAGQELGLRKMRVKLIHVLIPHGSRLVLPDVVPHQYRALDPVDVALLRRDGVRLTSPPRTLSDSASILDPKALDSAIEHALAERMCSMRTLLNTSARLFHGRRPGSVELRRMLLSRPVWRQAARSDLEVRFRHAVAERGLPEPLVNSYVDIGAGRPIEVDLVWSDQRVIGEIDHPFWHDGTVERHRDRLRDRRLAASGWLPVRFDEHDIELALQRALDDLEGVLVGRGWRRPLAG
jgi:very-short-patch-repair endonuclease